MENEGCAEVLFTSAIGIPCKMCAWVTNKIFFMVWKIQM